MWESRSDVSGLAGQSGFPCETVGVGDLPLSLGNWALDLLRPQKKLESLVFL